MSEEKRKEVLILYTGGTIGMLHKNEDDPTSPLVPAGWREIEKKFSVLRDLPFKVGVLEMDDLIDSSDMHPGYWQQIAAVVETKYDAYDGFVLLHGTDTMAYTATALSFFFENLGKPFVVTGSQLPLAMPRSDAMQNLVTALTIAAASGVPIIPEVSVLFDKKLLRGNRARKVSSNGFDGFDSPNCPPLAEIGEYIKVNEQLIRKVPTEAFFVNSNLEKNVMIFDIFPGISTDILKSVFSIKDLKGIVFRTYGAGNAPTSEKFLAEILVATKEKHIAVLNITQCNQGMVEMGLYDASAGLIRVGVLSGVDMTPEAALVKMMFLLGQGYDRNVFKEQTQRNLRGEQSVNVFNFVYDSRYETEAGIAKLETVPVPAGIVRNDIKTANIRFQGLTVASQGNENESSSVAVYINYPNATPETSTTIPQCLGVLDNVEDGSDFMLNCSKQVRQVLNPALPLQLTVVARNGEVTFSAAVLTIFTDISDE